MSMKRRWVKDDSNRKEKKQKTKFEEYLEWDMGGNVAADAEDDVKMEKMLAKKLKMKKRSKLGGPDDGMNFLIGESTVDPGFLFGDDSASKGEGSLTQPMEDDVLLEETGRRKKKQKKKSKQLEESESEEWVEESELGTSKANKAHEALESAVNSDVSRKDRKRKKKDKKMGKKSKQLEESESEELELGTSNANEALESVVNSDVLQKEKRKKKKEKKSKQPLEPESAESKEDAEPGTSSSNVADEPLNSVNSGLKYLGPHQRAKVGAESAEHADKLRLIKRNVNGLTGLNVESITQELATIFQSLPRNIGCQMIVDVLLKLAQENADSVPFAACVAGMACLVGVDFSAKFLATLAKLFEDLYANKNEQQDLYTNKNEKCVANLTRLLCYMYMFGVCSSDLIYDLLAKLSASLTELDAFLIKTILN